MIRIILFGPELITDVSEPVDCHYEGFTATLEWEWTIVWLIPTIPIPEYAQKNVPLRIPLDYYTQGCHSQGKPFFFFQGQGKVMEVCIKSGKF